MRWWVGGQWVSPIDRLPQACCSATNIFVRCCPCPHLKTHPAPATQSSKPWACPLTPADDVSVHRQHGAAVVAVVDAVPIGACMHPSIHGGRPAHTSSSAPHEARLKARAQATPPHLASCTHVPAPQR
jgi:hypothetical protein